MHGSAKNIYLLHFYGSCDGYVYLIIHAYLKLWCTLSKIVGRGNQVEKVPVCYNIACKCAKQIFYQIFGELFFLIHKNFVIFKKVLKNIKFFTFKHVKK